jgi:transposase
MTSPWQPDDPHPDMVPMSIHDVNDLDAVVHALGIEDSNTKPAEAVRELQERLEDAEDSVSVLKDCLGEARGLLERVIEPFALVSDETLSEYPDTPQPTLVLAIRTFLAFSQAAPPVPGASVPEQAAEIARLQEMLKHLGELAKQDHDMLRAERDEARALLASLDTADKEGK